MVYYSRDFSLNLRGDIVMAGGGDGLVQNVMHYFMPRIRDITLGKKTYLLEQRIRAGIDTWSKEFIQMQRVTFNFQEYGTDEMLSNITLNTINIQQTEVEVILDLVTQGGQLIQAPISITLGYNNL